MKQFLLAIAFITCICSASEAQDAIQTYSLNVRDFTELKVTDGINVDYYCNPDSAGIVTFDADPALSSAIIFEPKNGKLTIMLANREETLTGLPTVRVYSRYLSAVENDGDSLVRVMNVTPGPKFKARLVGNGRISVRDVDTNELSANLATGNGSIVVTGRADIAKLYLTGTGSITADGLEARDVRCRISGTGTIGCAPSELLSIKGVGSGTVYYTGQPEVKNKSLGIKSEKF